jgi:hypothetical protein
MIQLTRKDFSKAVAAVLKANFPALGTEDEMPGADTVDALSGLYEKALLGLPIPGMPDSNPDPTTGRASALAALSDAIRDLVSAKIYFSRVETVKPSVVRELDWRIEKMRDFLLVAEALSK